MIEIGKYNTLKVDSTTDFGVYLVDDSGDDVLLPKRYVDPDVKVGDMITVFIYNDSEDRIIATTEKPLVTVGEFAYLEVVDINDTGAFLGIGLMKDLLVPHNNQEKKMQKGRSYLVYVYLDNVTERLVGTSHLRKKLSLEPEDIEVNQKVDVLIGEETDLGYFAIVNKKYHGMLYENEVFAPIETGMSTSAYVKNIREDGKIDLILEKPGYDKVEPNAARILKYLEKNGGHMPYHDKSDPAKIQSVFSMSKKTFKKALGALYKARRIKLEKDGVSLIG